MYNIYKTFTKHLILNYYYIKHNNDTRLNFFNFKNKISDIFSKSFAKY